MRYEDVVDDLEASARKIVAHCGLDWDERCLRFYETQRPVLTASVAQVRRPIYQSSIQKWAPDETMIRPLLDALRMGR